MDLLVNYNERPFRFHRTLPKDTPENNLKEYLHHLSMAQASLAELETQLEIALGLKYLTAGQLKVLMDDSSSLGKQMYSLRNALRRT